MAPDRTPPRYSRLAFPAYRFIPGRSPHPTRDPAGHSYGKEAAALPAFDPEAWRDCEPYLHGVDLFNHGYWWEAHEAWEACWIAAGKTSPTGLFLQGLIQVAAACLKKHQGYDDAALILAGDGLAKFPDRVLTLLGIDTASFKSALQDFFAGKSAEQPRIYLSEGVRGEG
ncbi:MAG: DUF309 domain-containing protein [Gammaproteobacteria bacterium]|jgi:hypothetical protein